MCSSFMESPLSPVVPCLALTIVHTVIYMEILLSSFFLFFFCLRKFFFFLFSHGGISRENGELPSGPTYTANLLLSVLSARFVTFVF